MSGNVSGKEDRYRELGGRLYSAVISDALDALGFPDHCMSHRIRPTVAPEQTLIGRAATARSVSVEALPERPYGVLLDAMDCLTPGQVWVVASGGEPRSAIFGGLLATAARARGAIGCIVDGAVRDTSELERLQFPTFATGYSPADSYGRDEVIEHGEEIVCGGIRVCPGDLVFADTDGVVIVPQDLEEAVVEHALAKIDGEGRMRAELADGLSAADAFAKYGIL